MTLRLIDGREFIEQEDWIWEVEVHPDLYQNAPGPMLREVPMTVQFDPNGMYCGVDSGSTWSNYH